MGRVNEGSRRAFPRRGNGHRLLLAALLATWSVAAGAAGAAEPAAPVVARCALAENGAEIRRGVEAWAEVVPGEEVWAGDAIRTGRLASARLDFTSGGGLRLAGAAEVELKAGAKPGEPLVSLLSGDAFAFLDRPEDGRASPQVALELGAAARGVLEARGDKPVQVRLTRAGAGIEVAVLQGEAALLATGNEKLLSAGQAAAVVAGEVREVRDLAPAPEATAPGLDDRFFCPGLVLRLVWQPARAASGYRVQVATDASFQSLALDADVKGDHTLFVPRVPGSYAWRVAARGPDGALGDFSAPRPVFCEAEPPSDLLVAPQEAASFRTFAKPPPVLFQWKPWPGASSYRLVVAKGRDLHAADALVRTTQETSLELSELPEGEYVWGVYVDNGDQPLFLAPRHLVILRSTVKVPVTLKKWGG